MHILMVVRQHSKLLNKFRAEFQFFSANRAENIIEHKQPVFVYYTENQKYT